MKNIIMAIMAAALIISGANTAEAKGHRGHGGFRGGHHGGLRGFGGFPHCRGHYKWHNGHYKTVRFCKT